MISQSQIKLLCWYPILLLIYNFVTKFIFLTDQDISLDEPFTIYHAQFSFAEIVSQLKNYNNPPLFELLVHGWIKLFGISPLAVRIPPLIFASLSPVVLFYFCKRNFNIPVAVVSSLTLSGSSLLVYYAHDCRVYSLFLLLSICSMYFFMELLRTTTKQLHVLLFVSFNTLLLYAHYFGMGILLLQGLSLLIFYRSKILKLTAIYMVVAILYLPHIYVLLTRLQDSVSEGTWIQSPVGIESLYNMLWSFSNQPVVTVLSLAILALALVQFISKKTLTKVSGENFLVATWFILPFFGLFFVSYKIPVYLNRYLIFVLPAYYMLIAMSICGIFKKNILRSVILIAASLMYLGSTDLNPDKKRQIQPAVRFIQSLKDFNTQVVITSKDFLPTFAYHYNTYYFSAINEGKEYDQTCTLLREDGVFFVNNAVDLRNINSNDYAKMVCLVVGNNPAVKTLLKSLKENYFLIYETKFNDTYSVYVFRTCAVK